MGNYSIKGMTPQQVSRDTFHAAGDHISHDQIMDYAKIGCLQRIALSLESIVQKLQCTTTFEAARALIRMDKRMAQTKPLGRKKAA